MNLVIFTGRLTRDPKISHYTDGKGEQKQVATYTLAVSRYGGSKEADFPNLKAFGKNADFASNYLKQGVKINATCHVQTGNYTNKDAERNILSNPFKRFEDMNMLRHTKTLGVVEVDSTVWKKLTISCLGGDKLAIVLKFPNSNNQESKVPVSKIMVVVFKTSLEWLLRRFGNVLINFGPL